MSRKRTSLPQSTPPGIRQNTPGKKISMIAIGMVVAVVTGLGMWYPLQLDERLDVQHVTTLVTRSLQSDITLDWDSEIMAVIRLAKVATFNERTSQAAWQSSAKLFLADHPSYVAIYWADPAYRVRWMVPQQASKGTDTGPDPDPLPRADLQAAMELGHSQLAQTIRQSKTQDSDRDKDEATLSPSFRMPNGERAIRIVVPVHKQEQLIGFLVAVLEVRKTFDAVLADHAGLGYAIDVLEGDRKLYSLRSSNVLNTDTENFAQESEFRLRGATWRLRVWPEAELLREILSKLPAVSLGTGMLLGFLLMLSYHFAQTARRNSRELQRAHDEMEVRVQERTAEVHILSARLLQLQDEERRRIARELHDSTVQVLAGVGFHLEKASSLAVSGRRTGVNRETDLLEALHESTRLLEKATSEVRTISYLLHPPMLDDLGLEYALAWVVRGFTERSGIRVDLNLQPHMERLSPELEITLFRIVQEALTNIHRHSGSPSAKITISRAERDVTLEVSDVGRGIPEGVIGLTRDTAASLGVGISGMRERVLQLGGRLEILSSSRGTTIRTVLPLIISQDGSPTRVQKLPQLSPLVEGRGEGHKTQFDESIMQE